MNGRSNVVLLALVSLVAAAFAGCVEAPSFLTASDAEATARENKDLADNAAAAWNPEAVLVGVASFEASAAHAAESNGILPADPSVGNGRALLWFYAYQTPDGNESRVFRVDADGRIQVENTSMVPTQEIGRVEPIGAWGIDSDAAMGAARADPRFEAAAAAENASVVNAVGTHENATRWALVAIAEEGVVVAVVDATTGALVLVEEVDLDSIDVPMPPMPDYPGFDVGPRVHLEDEGTLDGSEPMIEFPFAYFGNGDEALLDLRVRGHLPGDRLAWRLEGPDGEKVDGGRLGSLLGQQGHETFEMELEQPGEYVLHLMYAPLAPTPLRTGGVDYAFTFVAGGELPAADDRK